MDDEDGHDEDFDDNELHDFGVGWDDRQDVDDRDDIDDGDDGDDGDEVRRRRRGKGKDKGKRKERAHPTEMRQLAGDSVKDAKAENCQKVTNSAPRSRIFKRIAEFLFSSDPDPHVVTDYNDHPTRYVTSVENQYTSLRQRYRKACGEFRSTGNGILASDRLRGDQSLYDKIVREFPHFPKMDGLFNKIPNFNPIVGTSEPAQSLSSQFATTFMGKSSGGGDTLGGDHAGSVPFQTAGMMFSSDIPFSSDAALFFNDLGASSFGPPSAQQSGHNNFGDLSMIDIDDADMQRIFDTAMQSTIGDTDFQPPLDSTMQFDLQRTGPTSFVSGADSMFNMSPPTSFVSRPDMSLPSPASANPQRTGPTSFVGGADSMFNMSPLASFPMSDI
ncbi:hypothetical protein A0H81_10268 [Grifola frondosa]|uniref:Uncharacterized protein n=1 Tax=Grifola frondosa TaxID=5627 RepID=A0A1C7LXL0_GRIFR|nr:hypothetical protein A0H81_10268 [Grifola frondosa]